VRRAAGEVLGDEGRDDAFREGLRRIDDVVREAEAVGDGLRIAEIVERAAVSPRAAEQAERDADHLVPGGHAAGRRDGTVHPAAHRDDHALSHRAPYAAAPARTCRTSGGRRSSTRSTSSAVVVGPTLTRTPPRA